METGLDERPLENSELEGEWRLGGALVDLLDGGIDVDERILEDALAKNLVVLFYRNACGAHVVDALQQDLFR